MLDKEELFKTALAMLSDDQLGCVDTIEYPLEEVERKGKVYQLKLVIELKKERHLKPYTGTT